MLVCLGYFSLIHFDETTYSAQSRIVVSTHVQEVGGLAQAQGRAFTNEDENIKVTAAVDGNTKTVTITAVTADESVSMELANEVVELTIDEAFDFVPENYEDPFNARIEQASDVKEAASSNNALKYSIVAAFAGLFLAICIVVVIDLIRRPVKSIEGIQGAVELPVIEKLPILDGGERLLANIRFASNSNSVKTICIIPVSLEKDAEIVAQAIEDAACAETQNADLIVLRQKSLSSSMKAAYESRDADATVLVATQWKDSMAELESAVAELQLAKANLVGIVFAS